MLAVFLLQGLEEVVHSEGSDFLVQVAQPVLGLLLPFPDLAGGFLQLFLQGWTVFLQFFFLLWLKGLVLLLAHGLAIYHRGKDEAHGCAQEGKTLFVDESLQALELGSSLLIQLPRYPGFVLVVLLALEGAGDLLLQTLEHFVHLVAQDTRSSRRQADGPRLIGVLEVVDVDPVFGHLFGAGLPLQESLDGGHLASASRAEGVDVVAVAGDVNAKVNGPCGPFLADDLLQFWQFLGARKLELTGVTNSS